MQWKLKELVCLYMTELSQWVVFILLVYLSLCVAELADTVRVSGSASSGINYCEIWT